MTEEQELLKRKAKLLLDEPEEMTFKVYPQNWFERFLMKIGIMKREKTFMIVGARLGTLIKLSDLLFGISYAKKPEPGSGQLDWAYDGVIKNATTAIKVIAVAIHNKRGRHPKRYERMIEENLNSSQLQEKAFQIIALMDVFSFMNTITSLRKLNILQPMEVSLQDGGIIAPEKKEDVVINGDQLQAFANVFQPSETTM